MGKLRRILIESYISNACKNNTGINPFYHRRCRSEINRICSLKNIMGFMLFSFKQCSIHSSFLGFIVCILIPYLNKTDLHSSFDKIHIS